jgi:hypothetical protein
MEKNISYFSLILVVLMIGVYLSREFTKSEYRNRLDKIEAVKDSLDAKMKSLDKKLNTRDTLLKQQIKASEKIIKEITVKLNISDKVVKEYDKNIDEIVSQL